MSTTWGQLKADIRGRIFPDGLASNLLPANNAFFVEAIMDLQKWIPCLQQDNTTVVPACATFYKCGITVLDAPRGYIKKLMVIDTIDQATGLEDETADDDYCREIQYIQIDPCHFANFWNASQRYGCCLSISSFFGLPPCTKTLPYPTPTDAGLPPGLPVLPLGYHYSQTSTDRADNRRSLAGVWALERGKIFIGPWLESTETIILTWDGLKRVWSDADLVDDDPDLARALAEYVRYQHMDKFDKDPEEMARAYNEYNAVRAILIRECKEETRVRLCEPSFARSSTSPTTSLYYNNVDGVGHAECPTGQEGDATSSTVPAGTVSSTESVEKANQLAQQQAQAQAEALLVCNDPTPQYTNTVEGRATVACLQESGAPIPDGAPVTRVVPVGTVSGASVAAANAAAQAQAEAEAADAIAGHCTFKSRAVTRTAVCQTNSAITASGSVAEAEFTSTSSQAAADQLAENEAQTLANEALDALGTCGTSNLVYNSLQTGSWMQQCNEPDVNPITTRVTINWAVAAGYVSIDGSGMTVEDAIFAANQAARVLGNSQAIAYANSLCHQHIFGTFTLTIP